MGGGEMDGEKGRMAKRHVRRCGKEGDGGAGVGRRSEGRWVSRGTAGETRG